MKIDGVCVTAFLIALLALLALPLVLSWATGGG